LGFRRVIRRRCLGRQLKDGVIEHLDVALKHPCVSFFPAHRVKAVRGLARQGTLLTAPQRRLPMDEERSATRLIEHVRMFFPGRMLPLGGGNSR
jgi:hypothetical protein